MKNWQAMSSQGGIIGIILTTLAAVALALAGWATWLAANSVEIVQAVTGEETGQETPELLTIPAGANLGTFALGLFCFLLLGIVLVLAYHTFRFFKINYTLDRNAVTIEMGDSKQIIPLANIKQVVLAANVMNQMRSKVYGGKPDPNTTGTGSKAYPRPKPGSSGSTQTEVAQELEAEVEEFRQAASAADASVEHFDNVEIISPETKKAATNDSEIAEAEIVEARFVEVEAAPATAPTKNGNGKLPHTEPVPGLGTSVNFAVKAKPFTYWPGFYLNRARVNTLGAVQFYATQKLEKTVLIRTDKQIYAISPADPEQFVTEYKLRRRLGAIEPVDEVVEKGAFLNHPLWYDRMGRAMLFVGIFTNLLLFAALLGNYNNLPPQLQIHFNKFGQVDRIGERADIMALPFIGLLVLFGNSILGAILHPKERIPAYLLYGSAILLQLLTAIAVLVILIVS